MLGVVGPSNRLSSAGWVIPYAGAKPRGVAFAQTSKGAVAVAIMFAYSYVDRRPHPLAGCGLL